MANFNMIIFPKCWAAMAAETGEFELELKDAAIPRQLLKDASRLPLHLFGPGERPCTSLSSAIAVNAGSSNATMLTVQDYDLACAESLLENTTRAPSSPITRMMPIRSSTSLRTGE